MTDVIPKAPADQPVSTADLIHQATEQATRLVRDEIALAKAEMAAKGKQAGVAAGLLGGGGLIALYGVAALLAAAVLGLAEAMPAWLAALLVAIVLLAAAAIMALVGRGRAKRAAPPVPTETMESLRADITEVTERARR